MRRFVLGFALGAALALSACAHSPTAAPRLTETWRLAEGLANPESALLSADGRFFYVSNVAGEGDGRDGTGSIATVSRDGRLLNPAWVTGLNAPKGMALAGGTLYVSDIDALVAINAATSTCAPWWNITQGLMLAVDYETRGVSLLAEGLASADGVAAFGSGHLVSSWRGQLFFVAGGVVTPLLDTREAGILLNDFALIDDMLVMPNFEPSTLTAYRLG